MKERDFKKKFTVFKSQVEKVIKILGYESRFEQAFEYYIRDRFHYTQEKLNQNLNQLEKLLNEEELHTCDCRDALKVIQTQF